MKRSRASEHSRKGTDSRKGTRKGTEAEKSSERTGEEKKLDVALVHGVGPDGKSLRVLRARDDRIELGSVEPLEEGRPIYGEVIRLRPRQEFPLLCDVEVQYRPEAAESKAPARSGPPLVASESYRDNWELIWAKKRRKRELSN